MISLRKNFRIKMIAVALAITTWFLIHSHLQRERIWNNPEEISQPQNP